MRINDEILFSQEKIAFALRELYLNNGYRPYRMSKFEEYDLYASNKDFLVSDQVITFTDTDGKLMALKPDVTLSIIKNSADEPGITRKVFYHENVYRVSKGTDSFQEILQTGVECFGSVGTQEICEVLTLAAESLRLLEQDAVLTVSDLDILSRIVARLRADAPGQEALYQAVREKNLPAIGELCRESEDRNAAGALLELVSLRGSIGELLPRLRGILRDAGEKSDGRLCTVLERLSATAVDPVIEFDFSVTGDPNYYNGIIFKGFLRGLPVPVLSGGQYDRLMRRLGRHSCAVGFAVNGDALDRLEIVSAGERGKQDDFLNVALPKGRLGEQIYDLFARAGFECPALLEPNRKLIFENPEKKVRYFWVKPSDVAIYVERGAADIGVAGKDILLEYEPEVYELLDLKRGVCRMAVAAPEGFQDDPTRTLRVATKFANVARAFYRAKGRDIDIIHLNGSIEIAPILGLSDVIVDIVETGTTLRENHLEVVETVFPISARLIANQSSFQFKSERIKALVSGLSKITEEQK